MTKIRPRVNLAKCLTIFMAVTSSSISNGESILRDLSDYEDVRARATTVARDKHNNLDIVTTQHGKELGFCHIALMMPFSYFPPPDFVRTPLIPSRTLEGSLAVLLAAQHLNSGDASVVPEVEGLTNRCSIRFTTELFDTEYSSSATMSQVDSILDRTRGVEQLPCAFLGNSRSGVSIPSSIITGIGGYPQLSPISTSTSLDDKAQHPYFGRLIPSDDGTAIPAILFLKQQLQANHVAVIHRNDAYGNAYIQGLLKAAGEYAPKMTIKHIDIPGFEALPEHIEKAVSFLKSTQYRYFFCMIDGWRDFNILMEKAYEQEIAGTGQHNWIFSDSLFDVVFTQEYEKGSPLHLATRGVSMLAASGGIPGMPVYNKFIKAWKTLNNPDDIEYIKTKHPKYSDPDYTPQPINDDFFAPTNIGLVASYLYDSTIALGLAACRAARNNTHLDVSSHYKEILESNFQGATGNIVLDKETGTRSPQSATFELTNYVENEVGGNVKVTFSASQSALFQGGEWNILKPIIFNDGTSEIQPDLPPVKVDMNYIGTGLRAAGLAMAGVVLVLSVGFAFWVQYCRKSRVVMASQRIFLHIICFGVFLMGLSIIPLSVDDEIASESRCSLACMAFPWLLCLGFAIAFAALCAKMWRVNKILNKPNMKRIKVSTWDVMKFLLAFLAVNIFLLSVWTAISPLEWEREISGIDQFNRTIESRGFCTSASYLPFAVVLLIANLGVLAFVLQQAYLARDISTEFSESEYIAKAFALCLMVCFVGIPVVIIATNDPRALFFVLCSIIFVVATSLMLFIFVPKVMFHRSKVKGSRKSVIEDILRRANANSKKDTNLNPSSRIAPAGAQGATLQNTTSPLRRSGMSVAYRPRVSKNMKLENIAMKEENRRLMQCNRELRHHNTELRKLLQDSSICSVLESHAVNHDGRVSSRNDSESDIITMATEHSTVAGQQNIVKEEGPTLTFLTQCTNGIESCSGVGDVKVNGKVERESEETC